MTTLSVGNDVEEENTASGFQSQDGVQLMGKECPKEVFTIENISREVSSKSEAHPSLDPHENANDFVAQKPFTSTTLISERSDSETVSFSHDSMIAEIMGFQGSFNKDNRESQDIAIDEEEHLSSHITFVASSYGPTISELTEFDVDETFQLPEDETFVEDETLKFRKDMEK